MSYRVKGLGMDRELERKIEEKYSLDDENEVVQWINEVLNMEPESDCPKYPEETGSKAFHKWLMDGIVLCELMNKLTGAKVCKYKNPSTIKLTALRQNTERDNIFKFLKAAENYGVGKINLFQTVSLYEATNLPQVITALYEVGSEARNNNFCGPVIGVKKSHKNVREFDQQTLSQGKNIIGLQMGTNQVASQQGMTPYGLGRQLAPKSRNGCS